MTIELPVESLRNLYPYPDFEFESRVYARDRERRSLYRVLVLFLLSAGTQDRILVKVCSNLFDSFPEPEDLADSGNTKAILEIIRPSGLQKRKLEHIRSAAHYCIHCRRKCGTTQSILSSVADNPAELWQIRGVGGKVFECVMAYGCGKPTFPLDINVIRTILRICGKSGVEDDDMDYVSVRQKLKAILDPAEWIDTHEILRLHGLAVCRAANPQCKICPLSSCQSRQISFNEEMGISKARQEAKRILINEWGPWRELICDSPQSG